LRDKQNYTPIPTRVRKAINIEWGDAVTNILDCTDNSLDSGATEISLELKSHAFIISDNGSGMDREELTNALKYFHSEKSEGDIGVYGYGLKAPLDIFKCLNIQTQKEILLEAELESLDESDSWVPKVTPRELKQDDNPEMRNWLALCKSKTGTIMRYERGDCDLLSLHGEIINGIQSAYRNLTARIYLKIGDESELIQSPNITKGYLFNSKEKEIYYYDKNFSTIKREHAEGVIQITYAFMDTAHKNEDVSIITVKKTSGRVTGKHIGKLRRFKPFKGASAWKLHNRWTVIVTYPHTLRKFVHETAKKTSLGIDIRLSEAIAEAMKEDVRRFDTILQAGQLTCKSTSPTKREEFKRYFSEDEGHPNIKMKLHRIEELEDEERIKIENDEETEDDFQESRPLERELQAVEKNTLRRSQRKKRKLKKFKICSQSRKKKRKLLTEDAFIKKISKILKIKRYEAKEQLETAKRIQVLAKGLFKL